MTERAARAAVLGFGATLFVSASLLFCVEPMVAKMLLPLLGGAPSVWITCMLFFQAALLLGYAYAHASVARLGVRRQAWVHLGILALPFLVLPIHVRAKSVLLLGRQNEPVLPLLGVLAGVVGLPFFVVGATAPLVQKWFSAMSHDEGKDPYFLYGASNLGSLLALAAYPALIEPWIGLSLQARLWTWGYGVLALLVAGCAIATLRRMQAGTLPEARPVATREAPEKLTVPRRVRWVVYAFVPSSLLLGVTAYVTTDVAPIPLFWVVPLALYLTTFIFVFARRPPLRHALMVRALPFGATATVMMLLVSASTPMALILLVHLATFFVAAMVCHGELALDRPSSAHLTEFYLWVSVGGVLGGVANGLVAPQVFDRLSEYPIALLLALACRRPASPTGEEGPADRPSLHLTPGDVAFTAAQLALTYGLLRAGIALHLDPSGQVLALVFLPPLFLAYSQLHRPLRFALALAATLVGGAGYESAAAETLHIERNFFGIARVTRDAAGRFTQIAHGNTIHGRQWQDPTKRLEPTTYYTRSGPLGQIFDDLASRERRDGRPGVVGVVGLGAGAMASYARPTERWTFYEINPAVVRIARDPRYFTFIDGAFGSSPRLSVVLGDARLRLGDVPDGAYDLLVIDAFSSDAIPAHLLTREAVALYLRKLSPGGVLAAHISNRYLDLAPVLANLATDGGLRGFLRVDRVGGERAAEEGWTPSIWAAMAKADGPPLLLANDARWQPFLPGKGAPWSDDFSDLVRSFHW